MKIFGSKNPKFKNKTCYGYDLRRSANTTVFNDQQCIQINYLIDAYKNNNARISRWFF